MSLRSSSLTNTPAERFIYIVEYLGWTHQDAAGRTGLPISKIRLIDEGGPPSLEDINHLIDAVPEVSVTWLIKGEGEPFVSPPDISRLTSYKDICDRFKRVRIDANMTQEDFAKLLGIARTTVSSIERGAQAPSYAVLRILNRRYGIPYQWLVDGVESDAAREVQRLREENKDLKASVQALRSVLDSTK